MYDRLLIPEPNYVILFSANYRFRSYLKSTTQINTKSNDFVLTSVLTIR